MTAKKFWIFWVVTLFIKFILSLYLPMGVDESYYWVWSKNLQLSYFDHPPMVAWLFKLGEFSESFLNSVRWPAVFVGHLTLVAWYLIFKKHFEFKEFKSWFFIFCLSPILGMGSLIITPDLPLIAFWSFSIYFFLECLERPTKINYFIFGSMLGLGFLSKYHIVIFIPAALGYIAYTKKWSLINKKYLFFTFISGLIFSSPVIYWNYLNDFSSFKFQLNHGLNGKQWTPSWIAGYLVGQFVVIFPLMFISAAKKNNKIPVWLYFFGWTPLCFFLITSLKGNVEINWPMMGYPAIYAIAIINSEHRSWFKKITIASWICIYVFVAAEIQFKFLAHPPRKFNETFQYEPALQSISKYQPIFANTYQMASFIWYRTKKPFYKLYDMSRRDFYDDFPQAYPKESPFYVFADEIDALPSWIKPKKYKIKIVEKLNHHLRVIQITRRIKDLTEEIED